MHCAVHEIMGSRNRTGKKGVNLAKKGVKIEFSIIYQCIYHFSKCLYLTNISTHQYIKTFEIFSKCISEFG